MSIEHVQSLVLALSGVPWLSRRGDPERQCICVASDADALYYLEKHETKFMGMADLLRERWRAEVPSLPDWNTVVRSVRPVVDQFLGDQLPVEHTRDRSPLVWGRIRTVILMASIETAFGLASESSLWQRALHLVRRGHLPVGWDDDTGRFIIW